MLDDIIKIAAELVGLSVGEVRQAREALLDEITQDDARYAARTSLRHPEGSTTPLNDAAERSQQTYARVRKHAAKVLPKMLATILAEQVARQQRDEAIVARDRHWDEERERRAVGPHPETRDLFARLFKHGVTPWHLKALRDEDVAIIADQIRWKAKDPTYKDPDTPWRPVLAVYANRLILEPGPGVQVMRSTLGTPVRGKRYSSPKYYMFNELFKAKCGGAPPSIAAADAGHRGEGAQRRGDAGNHARPDDPDQMMAHSLTNGRDAASPPIAATTPPPVSDPSDEKEPVESAKPNGIDEHRAKAMAEAVYAADGPRMAKFWPADIRQGEYDPAVLIPALNRIVESGEGSDAHRAFLQAARSGRAREFIANKRSHLIQRLTWDLEDGWPTALDLVRDCGLIPR